MGCYYYICTNSSGNVGDGLGEVEYRVWWQRMIGMVDILFLWKCVNPARPKSNPVEEYDCCCKR